MDLGKKAELEIHTNSLQYGAPNQCIFTEKTLMHQTIKYSALTKAKHFAMPPLNQCSHLGTHASHIELCCNVGNKTRLPSIGTHSCQPTHSFPSPVSTTGPLPSAAPVLPQHCFTYQQQIQKLAA